MSSILAISFGAIFGALLRWWLGFTLNSILPTLPLGTLAANLLGGFIIGMVIAVNRNHAYFPEAVQLMIVTGFLGSLTTFSTFSAEAVTLISHQEYVWSFILIMAHVAGSIGATMMGIYTIKMIAS